MRLKEITKCKQDGQIVTKAYLVEDDKTETTNPGAEQTIYEFGSLENVGINNLIELSNSVHSFFLDTAIVNQRDSIISSRSYGIVYLVKRMLEELEISEELFLDSDNAEEAENLFDLLPSLITALLDSDLNPNSRLKSINRRIHIPKDGSFTAEIIRDIIHTFGTAPKNLPACGTMSDDYDPNGISSLSTNSDRLIQQLSDGYATAETITDKLHAWAMSDSEAWAEFNDFEGLFRIASLALYLRDEIEKRTFMTWETIEDNLTELNAIRVVRGAKAFLITTRPTSTILNIFYRLEIEVPPLVILEEDLSSGAENDGIISSLKESVDFVSDMVSL